MGRREFNIVMLVVRDFVIAQTAIYQLDIIPQLAKPVVRHIQVF